MKTFSVRTWGLVHTWSSLVCTAFLVMLCVTGLTMIWINEIDGRFAGHPPPAVLPANAPPANLDSVFAAAERQIPGSKILYVDWAFDGVLLGVNVTTPSAPSRRQQLIFDARTAAYLENLATDRPNHPVRQFLHLMNRLHIEMYAGLPGEMFLAAMTVLFVVATISGLVLYGPFARKGGFGAVRTDRTPRARWLDTHNLLGVVTAGWLLVVGVTGIMNAFTQVAYAKWRGETLPALVAPYRDRLPAQRPIGPQAAVNAAHAAIPGSRMVRIVPAGARDGSPRHYVVWTRGDSPVSRRLFRPVLVESETGDVIRAGPPPFYLSALQFSRPLHFGDYGGVPLKVLWTLLDLVAIAILITGIYLWLGLGKRAMSSTAEPPAAVTTAPATIPMNARGYFRRVFAAPLVLAAATVVGLLAALFGGATWHPVSWIALATPPVVMAVRLLRKSPPNGA